MRSLLLMAVLAASVLVPASARAQASQRDAVAELLQDAARGATENGFRAAARVFDTRSVMGMLPRDGTVVLEANLRAGVRYTVVAVCDAQCVDLDLRAHAPGGEDVLAEDVSTDDVPVLTFTAAVTGPHPISVIMSECRAEQCHFGLRVLSR
jgi:type II secretory pathway pseudopilin PulG